MIFCLRALNVFKQFQRLINKVRGYDLFYFGIENMKLTDVALRWAKRLPRGHIFRGKYRLVKKVTPLLVAKKRAEFELEERNMFYLRNPYMTLEQCHGHAVSFNHHQKFLEKHRDERINNFKKHKLLGDRFGFLKVADRWE